MLPMPTIESRLDGEDMNDRIESRLIDPVAHRQSDFKSTNMSDLANISAYRGGDQETKAMLQLNEVSELSRRNEQAMLQ